VRLFRRIFLLILLWLLFPVIAGFSVAAGSSLDEDQPVHLDADQLEYDQQSGEYRAVGEVVLRQGQMTLFADEVWWHPETGKARARGDVRLLDPRGEMAGEELSLELDTGGGRLSYGTIFLRDRNLHVTGDSIERLSSVDYRIEQGEFTTCDGKNPAWKFRVSDLEVTRGKFARGRNARFYLKNIPIFYTPYFLYPVQTERQSGLLMPRYGYSNDRGWQLSNAYYQVLAQNQDMTFYLDYFSDLGIGKGLEYRYAFRRQEGEAKIYHVSGFGEEGNALAIDWRNQGWLPGKIRSVAAVEYVDDDDYFSRFGEVAGEYNKDKTESKIFLSRAWGNRNLTAQFKHLNNLDRDTDRTLQRLPQIHFTSLLRRVGDTSFFTRLDATYDHFYREEGQSGQRLFVRPALSAPFQLGFLEVSPEIGFTQRFYYADEDSDGESGSRWEQKGVFDLGVRMSSSFSRVFRGGPGNVSKIQHIISPEVTYTYVPRHGEDDLPYFDRGDRLARVHRISYGLTNRLTARIEPQDGAAFYHEFLYFRLSQEYDFVESRKDPLNPRDNFRPFSALRTEVLLRPTRWSYVNLDSRYDFETAAGDSMKVADMRLELGADDGRGNGVSAGYHYLRDDQEYVQGELRTSLLDPVHLRYLHRYDLVAGRDLEKVLDVEYRAQCWSMFFTLRDRLEDTEFLVTFSLSGLGRIANFGGALGSGG